MRTMNILSRLVVLLPFAIFSLCVDQNAIAGTLDANAVKKLVSDRTWMREPIKGGERSYWSWKSDGTVCLRLFEKVGKCDDKGRWKINSDRICYELEWWGENFGIRSACHRISDLGKGRYGALQENGLISFEFTITK